MHVDLVVTEGHLVTPGAVISAGIAVNEGKIVAICKDPHLPPADHIIKAEGLAILPGAVDLHAHLGGKHPLEADFRTETPGALVGGVTSIGVIARAPRMGQPFKELTEPGDVVSWSEVFELGKSVGEANSVVDFHFTFTLNSRMHAEEIPKYVGHLGVTSFKYHGNIKNLADHPMGAQWAKRMALPLSYDDSLMYLAMERIASVGPPAVLYLHCENSEISKVFQDRLIKEGRKDPLAWSERLPGFLEAEHVHRYSYYSRITGSAIHVLHLSSKEGLQAARHEKKRNPRLTIESSPQYLVVTCDKAGFLGKLNPPLRTGEDKEALWEGLKDGVIDTVGSDHVVSNKHEKLVLGDASGYVGNPSEDIWATGSGSVGMQTLLPVMLGEGVAKRNLPLTRLVQALSYNPAGIAGLYPRKGVLQVGSDADIVLVDLKRIVRIKSEMLESYGDFTLFDGLEVRGWPVMTILRGVEAMHHGEVLVKPGFGKHLTRGTQLDGHTC